MTQLSALQTQFINRFQGGFPLAPKPYALAAAEINTDEHSLLGTIQQLLDQRIITRFGPFYNADRMGGAFTLAAMKVPSSRYDQVAELVNAHQEVAHNYQREHELNMWFVIGTESAQQVTDCIHSIEQQTGLEVYNFPKLQEFYLGLQLKIGADGLATTVPMDVPGHYQAYQMDEADRTLVAATQQGLPLVSEPYAELGALTGLSQSEVIQRMQAMLDSGIIRRIGAAPNHYQLGLKANGMTVWAIRDELLPLVGTQMGALDFVSHCYERPRHLPDWPYNLFAMIHGVNREQVQEKLALMKGLFPYEQVDVLYSSAILKKTGLRIAA